MPELNFLLNFKRTFSTTWVNNQGLGHVGGHGHAANLPYILFLWLTSMIIPQEALRSTATLFMFVFGGLGAYYLSRYLFRGNGCSVFPALISSLFYTFNLATIQQFFTPLESFILFHGLLPWMLLTIFQYLDAEEWNKWKSIQLVFLSFIFSAIGFLPPLFVVFGLMLLLLSITYLLIHRTMAHFIRIFLLVCCVLITNLYWLTSVGYFTLTSADHYLSSLNNQLSTDGFNLQSIAYGGLEDIALLRGFVYWAMDSNPSLRTPAYVMQVWHNHQNLYGIKFIGITFFILAVTGGLLVLLKARKNYKLLSVVFTFILLFTALAERVPIIAEASVYLKSLPVINQAFRASFTKVSVPFALVVSILLGYTLKQIFDFFVTYVSAQFNFIKRMFGIFSIFLLLLYAFPLFTIHLFSPYIQNPLPQSYEELFRFFNKQPADGRIAVFPLTGHWGWHSYDWGYIGSGFYWYGIEQPILDRSFDSWSKYNETWYTELDYTVTNTNSSLLLKQLEKYHITWILIDPHLQKQNGERQEKQLDFLKATLRNSPNYKERNIAEFILFEDQREVSKVTAPGSYISAFGETDYTFLNPLFDSTGNYIEESGTLFPFSFLATHRSVHIDKEKNGISIRGELPSKSENSSTEEAMIVLPQVESPLPADVAFTNTAQELVLTFNTHKPFLQIDGEIIPTSFSKEYRIEAHNPLLSNHSYFLHMASSIFIVQPGISDNYPFPITLKPNTSLPYTLYSNKSARTISLQNALQSANLNDCNGTPILKTKAHEGNTIEIQTELQTCLSGKLGSIGPESAQLFSLHFSLQGKKEDIEKLCLSREEDPSRICYNQEDTPSFLTENGKQEYQNFFILSQPGTYWLDIRVAPHSEVALQNLNLIQHETISKGSIASTFWNDFYSEVRIAAHTMPKDISLFIPQEQISSFHLDTLTKNASNCDALHQGKTYAISNQNSVEIMAENGGISCAQIPLDTFTDQQHLVLISGQNLKGKPPEFSLFNPGLGIIESTISPKDQKFTFAMPSGSYEQASPSAQILSINLFSYPNTQSKGTVSELSLIEFPVTLSSKIRIEPQDKVDNRGEAIIKSTHNLYYHFLSATVSVEGGEGIVTLDEAFHPGWIAYQKNKPWKFFQKAVYNGWANAWILPEGNWDICILFWPQLLSFIGYGCGAACILLIVRKKS